MALYSDRHGDPIFPFLTFTCGVISNNRFTNKYMIKLKWHFLFVEINQIDDRTILKAVRSVERRARKCVEEGRNVT